MDEEQKVGFNNPEYPVDDDGEYDFTKFTKSKSRALPNKDPAHLSQKSLFPKEKSKSLV